MSKENKMDPETAIEVLKRMGAFFKLTKSRVSMENSGWNAVDEAIDIAVAALEEKVEL